MSPSWPYQFVAVLATVLCASTILPITPPELLAAAINTGLIPAGVVIFAGYQTNIQAVSIPSAPPNQPNNVPKTDKAIPFASAKPSVASVPGRVT
jgi:hypothetical protein